MTPMPLKPGKNPAQVITQVATILELPLTLVGSVIICGGVGYFLDRWVKTAPLFLLLFGAAGFGLGLWKVLQRLSQTEKSDGSGS